MRRAAWFVSLGLSIACGGSTSNASDTADGGLADDAGPESDGGTDLTCDNPLAAGGRFIVSQQNGVASFYGSVEDHATPQPAIEQNRVGDCAIYAFTPTLCEPACSSGICIESVCHSYPETKPIGNITLDVAGVETSVAPSQFGSYYVDTIGSVVPGDKIGVSHAGGSSVAAFDVDITAVAPMTGTFEDLVAQDGTDLTISWDPASSDFPGDQVVVHLDSDHHGLSAYIECVVPAPATSATIDKTLIDAILVIGESGIGTYIENSYIERRNAAYQRTNSDCLAMFANTNRNIFVDSIHVR